MFDPHENLTKNLKHLLDAINQWDEVQDEINERLLETTTKLQLQAVRVERFVEFYNDIVSIFGTSQENYDELSSQVKTANAALTYYNNSIQRAKEAYQDKEYLGRQFRKIKLVKNVTRIHN